jgi:hypothetical protein
MPRRAFPVEKIITILREAEMFLSQGLKSRLKPSFGTGMAPVHAIDALGFLTLLEKKLRSSFHESKSICSNGKR